MLAGLFEAATTRIGDWSGEEGRLRKEEVTSGAKEPTKMARGGEKDFKSVKRGSGEENGERKERKEKDERGREKRN